MLKARDLRRERVAGIVIASLAFAAWSTSAVAQPLDPRGVLMGFDGFVVRNQLVTGTLRMERFSYGDGSQVTQLGSLGNYGSFMFNLPAMNVGLNGVGIRSNPNTTSNPNSTTQSLLDTDIGSVSPVLPSYFPILDKGTFGVSFDPSLYTAELTYKPRQDLGNAATNLFLALEQWDGYSAPGATVATQRGDGTPEHGTAIPEGSRLGDQWVYQFPDLVNYYNAHPELHDADGFITIRNNRGAFNAETGYVPGTLNDNTTGHNDPAENPDPNFSTQNNLVQDPNGNSQRHGRSEQWDANGIASSTFFEADDGADFYDFEGHNLKTPNGIVQMVLQGGYEATATNPQDNWEIKSVVVRKVNPDNEVARLDARTGVSQRFGSGFTRFYGDDLFSPPFGDAPINVNGTDYYVSTVGQLQRFDQNGFTNLIINTDEYVTTGSAPDAANATSGIARFFPPSVVKFDGTQATVEIRAKLTVAPGAGQATNVDIVLKDMDGNDTAPGLGGEQYSFQLSLTSTPTTGQVGTIDDNPVGGFEMRTITIPLTAFTRQATAIEFTNSGDSLLTDFNLYSLGMVFDRPDGFVDLEIEYLRVVLPPSADSDFNDDGTVDGADFLAWQRGFGGAGTPTTGDANGDGQVNAADLTEWKNHFGGPPSTPSLQGVPEPTGACVALIALLSLAARRGRSTS